MKKKLIACLFCICLLPAFDQAISAAGDLPVKVKVIATLPGVEPAFSPDGKQLATIKEGAVKIWDVSRKSLIQTIDTKYKEATLVVYSPDGRMLAIASPQKGKDKYYGFELWRLNPAKRVAAVVSEQVFSFAFSPDNRTLAIGFESLQSEKKIWIYDIQKGRIIPKLPVKDTPKHLCYSPDGKLLVVAPDRIW
jgi:dipeptidyl aminopeptidase/acylaminoacyl peptidase